MSHEASLSDDLRTLTLKEYELDHGDFVLVRKSAFDVVDCNFASGNSIRFHLANELLTCRYQRYGLPTITDENNCDISPFDILDVADIIARGKSIEVAKFVLNDARRSAAGGSGTHPVEGNGHDGTP